MEYEGKRVDVPNEEYSQEPPSGVEEQTLAVACLPIVTDLEAYALPDEAQMSGVERLNF